MKIDLDLKKVKEYEKELVNYDGYLPSVLRWAISIEYMRNVMNSSNCAKIREQMAESTHYNFDQLYDELVDWCGENPQFKDILG